MLGLDFILLACSPRMLSTISHSRYENVKKQMERCLDHVIGEVPLSRKSKTIMRLCCMHVCITVGSALSSSPVYSGGWSKSKGSNFFIIDKLCSHNQCN